MYLKSLVLKGFKSFADRSTLSLEPGITAIVGPNGSGKSNISDAVLWVLGERNARHLRGQAMEDIIFSGSAARKAVSVAEVELVLDNTDRTLPLEFDEVAIARRMYRSGESEYLVNGVVSRRLDVLDILHDTGLGTGTHSIISQGSLDSILQSKPEDRRALIEEAAGVLKHKQRKEKSARKLAAMDSHLERVRDVAGEVARQLGPLERKAKRAAAYREARSALDDLKLALAIDDLRKLQGQWNELCEEERQAESLVDSSKEAVSVAERAVNDLQELMRRESMDAGELSRRHRRAASAAERLDGAEMLLREKRRASIDYQADMQASLEGSAGRLSQARSDLESAIANLAQARSASEGADSLVASLQTERNALFQKRKAIDAEADRLVAAAKECQDREGEAERKQLFSKESLSNGMAHAQLVESRKADLLVDLERATIEHAEQEEAAKQAKELLAQLEKREDEAQKRVVSCFELRESARSHREQVESDVRMLESEIRALEQAQRASRQDDPALVWMMDNAERFGGVPLARSLKVAKPLEMLVERLLGADLAALAVSNAKLASEIAEAIIDGNMSGDVTMLIREDGSKPAISRMAQTDLGHPLLDDLEIDAGSSLLVEAVLGDVIVCDTREDAFAAHALDTLGLRFVSRDGCAIWPSGRVRVFGAPDEQGEGVLARERRLGDLRKQLQESHAGLDAAVEASRSADEKYREAQAEGLKLGQELANGKGACAAAVAEEERAARRLSSVRGEAESLEKQLAAARQSVESLRADVESSAKELEALRRESARLTALRDEKVNEAAPLRKESGRLSDKLNEAKLEAAKLGERRTYAERMVTARQRDVQSIEADIEDASAALRTKAIAAERGQQVLETIASLSKGLGLRLQTLEEAIAASESSSSSIHADAAQARERARLARDGYDAASSKMAQVRVNKSRLEVQVENAVNTVTLELGVPLDRIDDVAELEDRAHAEEEAARLERRIKSMGAINPDAAEEYAQLKERYDYLAGQLNDMEAARRSLARIVRVIDRRMKDDFVQTFEKVNQNFNEVFGILFPGGHAYLSLEDPDDVEGSGVEVTAQPQGKRITKMMLMSGGEKSLTALALLFAVYKTRTTPFYILDEVEAALDDTNLRRLTAYIDTLRESTQLIMITHQRRTMEMADVLFGVSMQADGITKVISQKLERALELAE